MPEYNAATLQPDQRIHALLVSDSGRGKTSAAMSFVESHPGKKVYVLDWDDRAKGAVLGSPFLEEYQRRGDIIINRISPWIGTIPQGLKEVYAILENLDARVTKGEIGTVIADSTTSMRRFFVNESVNRTLTTTGRSDSLAHFRIGEAIMAGKPDHNYAATCMLNIIYDNLKTFKCNVFISTHLNDKIVPAPTPEDPERVITVGQTITAPGQLKIEIPSWFDEVWEFEMDASVTSAPPRRYVVFQGKYARTSFRDIGEMKNGKWERKHKLDITDKSLYQVLRPVFERMKAPPPGQVVEVAKK